MCCHGQSDGAHMLSVLASRLCSAKQPPRFSHQPHRGLWVSQNWAAGSSGIHSHFSWLAPSLFSLLTHPRQQNTVSLSPSHCCSAHSTNSSLTWAPIQPVLVISLTHPVMAAVGPSPRWHFPSGTVLTTEATPLHAPAPSSTYPGPLYHLLLSDHKPKSRWAVPGPLLKPCWSQQHGARVTQEATG